MKLNIKGISLLEILISLTILSIVTAITLPNLGRMLAQDRLDNTISSIYKSLRLARSYAVAHSTHVTLCPLVSAQCQAQWHNTLHLFKDINGNLTLDDGEHIIQVIEKVDERDQVTYPKNAITFRPDGSIQFLQSGSFVYCNYQYDDLLGNRITVSQVGRIRVRDSDQCAE